MWVVAAWGLRFRVGFRFRLQGLGFPNQKYLIGVLMMGESYYLGDYIRGPIVL